MEPGGFVRRCRYIAIAIGDAGASQPCELDILLDAEGGWSVDVTWPQAPEAALHLCSNSATGAAIIARLLAPLPAAPRPAGD